MRFISLSGIITTVLLVVCAVGLAVSVVVYISTAQQPAIHVGAVALGGVVATVFAAITTIVVAFISRGRWKTLEKKRLELAAARLSDPRAESKYENALNRLLDAAVADSAEQLRVAPDRLGAQILLSVGAGGDRTFVKVSVRHEVPVQQDHDAYSSTSVAQRAVDKNTPVVVVPEAGSSSHRWVVSVPIPSTKDSPPLGAITVSGTTEDGGNTPNLEDLEQVVSLLLSWARVAALQIAVPD